LDSKDIYNVTKDPISNKSCSFGRPIRQIILNNKMYDGFHKNILTVFVIDNNYKCFCRL